MPLAIQNMPLAKKFRLRIPGDGQDDLEDEVCGYTYSMRDLECSLKVKEIVVYLQGVPTISRTREQQS